jgi:Mlc titration factor MtfA (ptsG expression regulator)
MTLMLLAWFRRRRRRKLLAEPFPADWIGYLEANVPYCHSLSQPEQAKLRDDLRVFLAEKTWEGCAGLEVTDEMKVTVSALACLLVLGMREVYYDRVQSILMYPAGYVAPERQVLGDNVVLEGKGERLGEAHYRGPVLLAWAEIEDDIRHPGHGRNLVFHEFAHQLDMMNGAIDGTPLLADERQARRWETVMTAEYDRLLRAVERGRETLLDDYGVKDEGEFFAVATECFFDRPVEMRQVHPRLYEVLRDYYRQDPAGR